MPTTLPRPHEVVVPARAPERLGSVFDAARLARFTEATGRVRELMGDSTIWNVNSTAAGGGVAEMLRALLPWARGADIDTRWLVIDGDEDFFRVTKRIHNRLYGFAGDGGPLGQAERSTYARTLAANAGELLARIRPGDTVILHDPQTAGLIPTMKAAGARVVWRCHIGRDAPNHCTDEGWEFLRAHVLSADCVVFSRREFAPPWLPADRLLLIPPSLDPFSPKNQDLAPETVRRILVHVGLLAGTVDRGGPPTFLRSDGSLGRVERHVDILQSGPPPSPQSPLVVQVSRWDHAKDMTGVLHAFADHLPGQPEAHLLLAGPSVTGVLDDPEGGQVLQECMGAWQSLPSSVRGRVHLACLPMHDLDENAVIVNALQRHATVVTQKSLAEGFGLTVAEAMWKSRPVVASAVGGIRDQIVDGESGLLVGDGLDLAAFGVAIAQLLDEPEWASQLGKAAHERAATEFLGDLHLERWGELMGRLAAPPS